MIAANTRRTAEDAFRAHMAKTHDYLESAEVARDALVRVGIRLSVEVLRSKLAEGKSLEQVSRALEKLLELP